MKILLIFNVTQEQKESLGRKVKTEFMMSGEYLVDYLPDYLKKKKTTLAEKKNLSVI